MIGARWCLSARACRPLASHGLATAVSSAAAARRWRTLIATPAPTPGAGSSQLLRPAVAARQRTARRVRGGWSATPAVAARSATRWRPCARPSGGTASCRVQPPCRARRLPREGHRTHLFAHRRLLVLDERGCVTTARPPLLLAATYQGAARALRDTVVADPPRGARTSSPGLAQQEWGIDVVLEAGMARTPVGRPFVRGAVGPSDRTSREGRTSRRKLTSGASVLWG